MMRRTWISVGCLLLFASVGGSVVTKPDDATDVSLYFYVTDPNGDPNTSPNVADYDLYYVEEGQAMSAKADVTALAAADSAHADNKAFHVGQGIVRVDFPDAAFDGGVGKIVECIIVDMTGDPVDGDKDVIFPITVQLGLSTFDPNSTPVQVSTSGVAAVQSGLSTYDPNATPGRLQASVLADIATLIAGIFDPNTTPVQVSTVGVAAVQDGLSTFDPGSTGVTIAAGGITASAYDAVTAFPTTGAALDVTALATTTDIETAVGSTPVTLADGAHGGSSATIVLSDYSDFQGSASGLTAQDVWEYAGSPTVDLSSLGDWTTSGDLSGLATATALADLETHGDSTWATATGFSTHSASDVAALVLVTPAHKLVTTADGRIDVGLWLGTAPLALSSQKVQAEATASLGATAPEGWIDAAALTTSALAKFVTADTGESVASDGSVAKIAQGSAGGNVTVGDLTQAALAKFVNTDTGETAPVAGSVAQLSRNPGISPVILN